MKKSPTEKVIIVIGIFLLMAFLTFLMIVGYNLHSKGHLSSGWLLLGIFPYAKAFEWSLIKTLNLINE